MGKTKKMKSSKRSCSLHNQIEQDMYAKPTVRIKIREPKDEDEQFVDARLSQQILRQAHEQQQELEEDVGVQGKKPPNLQAPKLGGLSIDSDEEEKSEDDTEEAYYEDVDVNEEEARALEMFMSKNPVPQRTLADIIMEKITEKQTELHTQFSDAGSLQIQELDPRVKEMYEGVRQVLSKYRSGKIPKAFKIVPNLRNWEQILYVTDPPSWSSAAMYQATRIFASNMKEKMAQRFYFLVLYPCVRDNIAEYKQLNFYLYRALKKALYKPGAFMKGILLPLCESGTCTLREAVIIGSVIAKTSIPVLHSSAALLKIAEMEYTGANSIFLRIFFDKKYALPYRVVDAVVHHFLRFKRDQRELPVLWHQALLTFVQRYKQDVSSEQKEALLELLRYQGHPKVTPDIRRELQHAKCRDIEVAQEPMAE